MAYNVHRSVGLLDSLPKSWDGISKEDKIQKLLDVVQDQLAMVRQGSFDMSNGDKIAALALEAQLELAPFLANAEAGAKNAKNLSEYVEADVGNKIVSESSKKPSDPTIKRQAIASDEVKDAKSKAVEYERDHKKWRFVYEVLKEAHILFRNLSKIS